MKQISNLAILFLAILPIGCMQKSKTNVNSVATDIPNGKTFVPPLSDSSNLYNVLSDLHESGAEYKGYSWCNSQPEVKAQTLSVVVSDSMTTWANPTPDGTFMAGFPVSQDERNKDMQIISLSTIKYLQNQFQVSKSARYKILILIYQGATAVVYNNNDPSALYIHILLLDTNNKLILWHGDTPTTIGYYSDVDDAHNGIAVAAKDAAKLINHQLDVLFDEPDSTQHQTQQKSDGKPLALTSNEYYNQAISTTSGGTVKARTAAIPYFNKAITLDPKNYLAYSQRANCELELDRWADAKRDYDKVDKEVALTKDEYSVYQNSVKFGLYQNRGEAEDHLGLYSDAITDLDKEIALDPNHAASAYNLRGYAYYKLGKTKKNYRKAIDDYDKSVELRYIGYEPDFIYRDSAVAAMNKAVGP